MGSFWSLCLCSCPSHIHSSELGVCYLPDATFHLPFSRKQSLLSFFTRAHLSIPSFTQWKNKQSYNEHFVCSRHCDTLWGYRNAKSLFFKNSHFLRVEDHVVIIFVAEGCSLDHVSLVEGHQVHWGNQDTDFSVDWMIAGRGGNKECSRKEEHHVLLALSALYSYVCASLTHTVTFQPPVPLRSWSPGIVFCLSPSYPQYTHYSKHSVQQIVTI